MSEQLNHGFVCDAQSVVERVDWQALFALQKAVFAYRGCRYCDQVRTRRWQ